MLQLLVGAGLVALVGMALSDSEKNEKKKKAKKLSRQHKYYSNVLLQHDHNNKTEKLKMLFASIKKEQTKLKKERNKLYCARNNVMRASKTYAYLTSEIQKISYMIEQKQHDANKIRQQQYLSS